MKKKQFNQQQKLTIVRHAREIGFKDAARISGVHYTTVYDWQHQLEDLGKEVFLARTPKRPGRGIKLISAKKEKLISECYRSNPGFGPGQVRNQLRRQGETVSIRTVRRIMEANGYKGKKKKKNAKACNRFEAGRPLELGQMDILQFFINKLPIYLILLIDDFSRFILGWRLLEQTSIDDVIGVVEEATNRYGKLEELLTDRGFVFYSWRGANRFERYLEHLRIDHTHASAHHPQTLGKVEALNRRIKTELIEKQRFVSAGDASAAIYQWVEHYNFHRPHRGFGGVLVPAERFHGIADKVMARIAKGLDVTVQDRYIERSIVNLVLDPEGNMTLYLLGQAIGGDHVRKADGRRGGAFNSKPATAQGEGTFSGC